MGARLSLGEQQCCDLEELHLFYNEWRSSGVGSCFYFIAEGGEVRTRWMKTVDGEMKLISSGGEFFPSLFLWENKVGSDPKLGGRLLIISSSFGQFILCEVDEKVGQKWGESMVFLRKIKKLRSWRVGKNLERSEKSTYNTQNTSP